MVKFCQLCLFFNRNKVVYFKLILSILTLNAFIFVLKIVCFSLTHSWFHDDVSIVDVFLRNYEFIICGSNLFICVICVWMVHSPGISVWCKALVLVQSMFYEPQGFLFCTLPEIHYLAVWDKITLVFHLWKRVQLIKCKSHTSVMLTVVTFKLLWLCRFSSSSWVSWFHENNVVFFWLIRILAWHLRNLVLVIFSLVLQGALSSSYL